MTLPPKYKTIPNSANFFPSTPKVQESEHLEQVSTSSSDQNDADSAEIKRKRRRKRKRGRRKKKLALLSEQETSESKLTQTKVNNPRLGNGPVPNLTGNATHFSCELSQNTAHSSGIFSQQNTKLSQQNPARLSGDFSQQNRAHYSAVFRQQFRTHFQQQDPFRLYPLTHNIASYQLLKPPINEQQPYRRQRQYSGLAESYQSPGSSFVKHYHDRDIPLPHNSGPNRFQQTFTYPTNSSEPLLLHTEKGTLVVPHKNGIPYINLNRAPWRTYVYPDGSCWPNPYGEGSLSRPLEPISKFVLSANFRTTMDEGRRTDTFMPYETGTSHNGGGLRS